MNETKSALLAENCNGERTTLADYADAYVVVAQAFYDFLTNSESK